MIRQIRKKDLLLFYPYESMDPFLQAYQGSICGSVGDDHQDHHLPAGQEGHVWWSTCAPAAENGKEVTVLIELRARFDEQNNIDWSERLEDAGCRVIYGFEGYKVHSKVCLITYRNTE